MGLTPLLYYCLTAFKDDTFVLSESYALWGSLMKQLLSTAIPIIIIPFVIHDSFKPLHVYLAKVCFQRWISYRKRREHFVFQFHGNYFYYSIFTKASWENYGRWSKNISSGNRRQAIGLPYLKLTDWHHSTGRLQWGILEIKSFILVIFVYNNN